MKWKHYEIIGTLHFWKVIWKIIKSNHFQSPSYFCETKKLFWQIPLRSSFSIIRQFWLTIPSLICVKNFARGGVGGGENDYFGSCFFIKYNIDFTFIPMLISLKSISSALIDVLLNFRLYLTSSGISGSEIEQENSNLNFYQYFEDVIFVFSQRKNLFLTTRLQLQVTNIALKDKLRKFVLRKFVLKI